MPDGLNVYNPGRWLPDVYKPRRVGEWLRRRRIEVAQQILVSKGCRRIILYLWRHEFAWALEAAAYDLVCYHIDDDYHFSAIAKADDPRELELIRRADLVIVHSPKLMKRKGGINANTIVVPNGADFRAYSTEMPEPASLGVIPRPRAGYVGVVKVQLDFDLLLALSRSCPDWSFVMVGPRGYLGSKSKTVDELASRPNVYFVGHCDPHELPAYVQNLDVCMMCYEVNDYTNCIYPLKLHEYLAAGRPVVSAPIHTALHFSNVVRIATTQPEWETALHQSLGQDATSADSIAKRRDVACRHDWSLLVDRIVTALRCRLDGANVVSCPTMIDDTSSNATLEP